MKLGLLASLFLSALLSAAAVTEWPVYLRRAGPVRIGMSLAEVRRVLGDPRARLEGITPEELDSCAYLKSGVVPKHLGFMFAKGRVVRIDVSGAGIRTASGAGVGDTEDRIKQQYPNRIRVEPHHYLPETGHYLIYSPQDASDSPFGMVFETEAGKVASFRVGTQDAIALVEGCS